MNKQERKDYAAYRIETAKKTFTAAQVLADNGFWNSAVNRLYYSVFYAVNALLVLHEIEPKSHSGTKKMFSMHFIKLGKMDRKFGRLLSELYDWRQKGDYDNIFEYDEETVQPLFSPSKEMIEIIEKEVTAYLK